MGAPYREVRSAELLPRNRGVILGMVCGHDKFIGGEPMAPSDYSGTTTECICGCYTPDRYFGRY